MRNRYILLADLIGLAAATTVATLLGMDQRTDVALLWKSALVYGAVLIPVRIGAAQFFGLYASLWQHASLNELERIVKAWLWSVPFTFVAGLSALPAMLGLAPLPVASLVIDAMLALGVLAAPRLGIRFLNLSRRGARSGPRTRTLVVGAGEVGQSVLRASQAAAAKFEVVGFVDDAPQKTGSLLNGVYVYGRISDLPKIARELSVTEVVIAIADAKGSLVRSIVEMAASVGATTRTVPSLNDLVSGRVQVSQLRPVEIEDLLRRDAISTDLSGVRRVVSERVVLVTGAGGSIGSEICRQVAALEPSLLVPCW